MARTLLVRIHVTSSGSGPTCTTPSIFRSPAGAEMRVLSAIDLALWDLLGKALDTPVYHLIGGVANRRVRLYNTCFPYKYDFNKEPEKIMAK
jgi:galactonate dehydratase